MGMHGAIVAVVAGLITAALTGDALGAPVPLGAFVSYTGSVIANGTSKTGSGIDVDGEATGPQPAGLLVRSVLAESTDGSPFAGASALARGRAFPGALGGFVFVEAGITLEFVGDTPFAGAQARQVLEWGDRLLILGDSSLPPGTPVDVQATLRLADELTLSGRFCTPGFPGPTAQANLLVRGEFNLEIIDRFCEEPPPEGTVSKIFASEVSGIFTSQVGANVEVFGLLQTVALVSAGVSLDVFRVRGIVDAENTALVHIDCLTPGCSYETDSGFSYVTRPTAVPEPGTLTMIAIGMAWMWRRRMRPTPGDTRGVTGRPGSAIS